MAQSSSKVIEVALENAFEYKHGKKAGECSLEFVKSMYTRHPTGVYSIVTQYGFRLN